MKLSTTINFFLDEDDGSFSAYYKDLEHYAKLGFRCLDAIFCQASLPGSPLLTPNWEEWATKIKKKADELGIMFVQTHLPYYNFCDPRTGILEEQEELIRRSIVCTGILGAYWTVSHPATAYQESLISTGSKEQNLRYFEKHLQYASEYGVGICIENMADFPDQGYKRSYCATVEELGDLVDTLSVRHDNVGICWDFGHANLVYADQVSCLNYLGNRIRVTHVHDNSGKNDEHRAPYLGNVNWEKIMPALIDCGYEGNFSFEVKRLAGNVPEFIKDSYWAYMKTTGEYLLTLAKAKN